MRKIIGIGETVFDIIFKNNQPLTARPGGSVYNALISLGRLGTQPIFISEIGDDKIGGIIKSFLLENNVETQYIYSYDRGKTPLALAFHFAKFSPSLYAITLSFIGLSSLTPFSL